MKNIQSQCYLFKKNSLYKCFTSSRVLDGGLLELLATEAAGADTDGFPASFLRSLRGLSRDSSTVASGKTVRGSVFYGLNKAKKMVQHTENKHISKTHSISNIKQG